MMISKLSIFILCLLFLCPSCKDDDSVGKTKVNPKTISPTPEIATPSIVSFFNQIEGADSSKKLFYSTKWKQWLLDSKKVENSYSSYKEYKEANPVEVKIDPRNAYLNITEKSAVGSMSVLAATLFENSKGTLFLAKTETDYTPESTDCTITISQQTASGWKDVTENTLPNLQPNSFFTAHRQTAAQYPLISIDYLLPRNGTRIVVSPKVNIVYFCENDTILATDGVVPAQIEDICEAWKSFESTSRTLKWNKETSTFRFK